MRKILIVIPQGQIHYYLERTRRGRKYNIKLNHKK